MTAAPLHRAASDRGVDARPSVLADACPAGGNGPAGLACQCCGYELQQTSLGEGRAGALHAHVWCSLCGAGGCLSTNMPGRRAVLRRGRALRGGSR